MQLYGMCTVFNKEGCESKHEACLMILSHIPGMCVVV
jgi:hypothetical protein